MGVQEAANEFKGLHNRRAVVAGKLLVSQLDAADDVVGLFDGCMKQDHVSSHFAAELIACGIHSHLDGGNCDKLPTRIGVAGDMRELDTFATSSAAGIRGGREKLVENVGHVGVPFGWFVVSTRLNLGVDLDAVNRVLVEKDSFYSITHPDADHDNFTTFGVLNLSPKF